MEAEAELKGLRFRGMRAGRRWTKEPNALCSSLLLSFYSFHHLSPPPPSSPTSSSSSSPSQPPPSTWYPAAEMPGTLPRFPTVPALLGSLPRGISPPSLPRGITMPSLPSLPSMPRGVSIPSLPRGVSLPRPVVMSTVSAAPRRLLQDCCSVLDHKSAAGETTHTGVLVLQLVLLLVIRLILLTLIQLVLVPASVCNV